MMFKTFVNGIAVRVLLLGVIAGCCLLLFKRSDAEPRFRLKTKLVQPQQEGASLRLLIELRNSSGLPQRLSRFTGLFPGRVFLRDTHGEVHEFMQTTSFNLMMTSQLAIQPYELAPDAALRFEHSLSEFRHMPSPRENGGSSTPYPILARDFRSDCMIWSTMDVFLWKELNQSTETETTAFVTSSAAGYPK